MDNDLTPFAFFRDGIRQQNPTGFLSHSKYVRMVRGEITPGLNGGKPYVERVLAARELRAAGKDKEYTEAKAGLPFFIPQAAMHRRANAKLSYKACNYVPSGIRNIDVDAKDNLHLGGSDSYEGMVAIAEEMKERLRWAAECGLIPYILDVAISPGGDGLKVNCRVPKWEPDDKNAATFVHKKIREDLKKHCDINLDDAVKDMWACYLPYDPDIYVNDSPKLFTFNKIEFEAHCEERKQRNTDSESMGLIPLDIVRPALEEWLESEDLTKATDGDGLIHHQNHRKIIWAVVHALGYDAAFDLLEELEFEDYCSDSCNLRKIVNDYEPEPANGEHPVQWVHLLEFGVDVRSDADYRRLGFYGETEESGFAPVRDVGTPPPEIALRMADSPPEEDEDDFDLEGLGDYDRDVRGSVDGKSEMEEVQRDADKAEDPSTVSKATFGGIGEGAIPQAVADSLEPIWTDEDGKFYELMTDNEGRPSLVMLTKGRWTAKLRRHFKNKLGFKGDPKADDLNLIDLWLLGTKRIKGLLPLHFQKETIIRIAGDTYLNGSKAKLAEPVPDTGVKIEWGHGFEKIAKVLESMFPDPEKRRRQLYWLAHYYQSCLAGKPVRGLVNVLVGAASCGKGWYVNGLLGQVFGGAMDAEALFTGKDMFNDKIAENPILSVHDSTHGAKENDVFSNNLKKFAAEGTLRLRPMHKSGIEIPVPGTRCVVTLNDDAVSMQSLPRDNRTLMDKLLITRVEGGDGKDPDGNDLYFPTDEEIQEMLGAFLRYIVQLGDVPADIANVRFGVRGWMDEDLEKSKEQFDGNDARELLDNLKDDILLPGWQAFETLYALKGEGSSAKSIGLTNDGYIVFSAGALLAYDRLNGRIYNSIKALKHDLARLMSETKTNVFPAGGDGPITGTPNIWSSSSNGFRGVRAFGGIRLTSKEFSSLREEREEWKKTQ